MSQGRTAARQAHPWWVAVVSGMASYIDAAAIITSGIAVVIYQGALGLTPAEVGIIAGALTCGIAVGALVGGRLGDRWGRRNVFVATMALIVVGGLFLIFGSSAFLLVVGSLLVGFGTGADLPVSLATISEAASDANRGRLLGFSQILWYIGIIISIGLATAVGGLGRFGGQILYAHVTVIAVLVLLGRLTIPESRSWLAAQAERTAGTHTVRADRSKVRELVSGRYRRPFFALIAFYSLMNLTANTLGQFGTYLLVNVAHVSVPAASAISLVLIPVGLITAFWFMGIADGRRRFAYFTVGAVAGIISPLIPTLFGITVVTFVISGVISVLGAGFAGEALIKVWAQESFPTLLRATAQGTIIAVARFLAAALATVTPLIIAAGPQVLYGALTAVSALGFAIAFVAFRSHQRENEFDVEEEHEGALHSAG